MKLPLLVLVLFGGLIAQVTDAPPLQIPDAPGRTRFPGGRKQRDAIVKQDYKQNVEDATALARLAEDLKMELEGSNRFEISVKTIKEADDIEKLARKIHSRLNRY